MRRRIETFVFLTSLLLAFPLSATEIVVDQDGRTTSYVASSRTTDPIRIRVVDWCTKPKECEIKEDHFLSHLYLRYQFTGVATQPVPLRTKFQLAERSRSGDDLVFTIQPDPSTTFVIYNLVNRRDAKEASQLDEITKLTAEVAAQKVAIEKAKKEQKRLASLLAQTSADIGDLKSSAAEAAVKEIVRLQQERRDIQARNQVEQGVIDGANDIIDQDKEALTKLQEIQLADVLMKIGVVVQGRRTVPVVYRFSDTTTDIPARLDRLTNLTSITDYDTAYAIISNVVSGKHPNPFAISVAFKDGVAMTLTPVRTVQDVPGTGAKIASDEIKPNLVGESDAYRDVIAELESLRFHGGQVPQLTVKTRGIVVTEDKSTTADGQTTTSRTEAVQDIKLLDNSDLPQVRTHFRYNFTTGIAASTLRDPEFQKVVTTADDPATKDVNEARYRVDRRRGDRRLNGFLGLTYYWRGVDSLNPLTAAEGFIPNPTIGFGLNTPTENLFVGFSNEFLRNAQVVWGLHYGKITELVDRNEANEAADATAPITRKRFHAKPFVGLTLNLKFLDKVFGR